ncbi:MAG: hypothetical protein H0U77_07335 [Nocardioidaceae bacterium]|nr:hypothetical protein [Nocardioidaceae bacterium]
MRTVIAVVVIVWLLIGAFAAYQRDYYSGGDKSCADFGNIALTIGSGPLNYFGVNPKIDCEVPKPSE